MTVFITGATGILGSQLLRKFLNEGHHVIGLRRKNSSTLFVEDIKNKVQWVEGDILDISTFEELINPSIIMIHCAAIVSFSPDDEKELMKVNVEGTRNVVDVAIQNGVEKFIYISSIAAIGKEKGKETSNESSKWEDAKNISKYAVSKYLAELEVWRAFEEGVNGFMVNPSIILSQGNENQSSNILFKRIKQLPQFYPSGNLNYIDVRDVTEMVYKLHQRNIRHERYILNTGTISYHEFYQKVTKVLKCKPPKFKVGKAIATLYFIIDYLKSVLTGSKRNMSRGMIVTMNRVQKYNANKIQETIQHQTIKLEDTLQWILTDYK